MRNLLLSVALIGLAHHAIQVHAAVPVALRVAAVGSNPGNGGLYLRLAAGLPITSWMMGIGQVGFFPDGAVRGDGCDGLDCSTASFPLLSGSLGARALLARRDEGHAVYVELLAGAYHTTWGAPNSTRSDTVPGLEVGAGLRYPIPAVGFVEAGGGYLHSARFDLAGSPLDPGLRGFFATLNLEIAFH